MSSTSLCDTLELASAGQAEAKPPERFELSTPALRKRDLSEPEGTEQEAEHRSSKAMLSASAHSEKRWVHDEESGEPSRSKTARTGMAGQLDVDDDVESQLSEFETRVLATIRRLNAAGVRCNVGMVAREMRTRHDATRIAMVVLRRVGLWDPRQQSGVGRTNEWVPSEDEITTLCRQIRLERAMGDVGKHGDAKRYYQIQPPREWTVDDMRRDWRRREARRRRAGAAAVGTLGRDVPAPRAEETPREGVQRSSEPNTDPEARKPLERFLEAAEGLAAAGRPVTANDVCRAAGLSLASAWSFRAILEKRGLWRWKSDGRPLSEERGQDATARGDSVGGSHMSVERNVEEVLAGQPPSLLRVYRAACDLEAAGEPVFASKATQRAGLVRSNASRYRRQLTELGLWRWGDDFPVGRPSGPRTRKPSVVKLDTALERLPAPVVNLVELEQPAATPSSNGCTHVSERLVDDGEVVAIALEIRRLIDGLSSSARAALLRHLNEHLSSP